ncbi:hypothetical protein RJT34_11774 [Clitoria ternatea]|uniref:Uncharacterized protein n=1 Tax=Clitoria ternatea TaxID=43366 RepID=A0AAN9PJV0_CLITE
MGKEGCWRVMKEQHRSLLLQGNESNGNQINLHCSPGKFWARHCSTQNGQCSVNSKIQQLNRDYGEDSNIPNFLRLVFTNKTAQNIGSPFGVEMPSESSTNIRNLPIK